MVDLLAHLAGPERKEDRLRAQIEAWRSAHDEDRRPTALELALFTGQPHDLRSSGGWFGALAGLGELEPAEAAAVERYADFFTYIEHGAYTKSYKLVTLKVLAESGGLREGMRLADLASAARWEIDRDDRLRMELSDAGFAVPSRPTAEEWLAYWRRNPIAALTTPKRGEDRAWFAVVDDRLVLDLDVPDSLASTLSAMVEELVEYRLHRYITAKATRRAGERRQPLDARGEQLDAAFVVESVDGAPVAIYYESAGGTAGSKSARNLQYVDGLDVLLLRMRDLGLVIEDAYIDTQRTADLPIPDRRLSPGEGLSYPVALAQVDDLVGLRVALLRSMARVGRAPGVRGGGGNSRKAMRVVISNTHGRSARELADVLAFGTTEVYEHTAR